MVAVHLPFTRSLLVADVHNQVSIGLVAAIRLVSRFPEIVFHFNSFSCIFFIRRGCSDAGGPDGGPLPVVAPGVHVAMVAASRARTGTVLEALLHGSQGGLLVLNVPLAHEVVDVGDGGGDAGVANQGEEATGGGGRHAGEAGQTRGEARTSRRGEAWGSTRDASGTTGCLHATYLHHCIQFSHRYLFGPLYRHSHLLLVLSG